MSSPVAVVVQLVERFLAKEEVAGSNPVYCSNVEDQLDTSRDMQYPFKHYRGIEQLAARQAHNLEVEGSSPSPATQNKTTPLWGGFV